MMVMGTAYDSDTLLYDQIHRRDAKSEGYENYPSEVRKIHKEWTRQIWESSEAKVEVVYGQKAAKAIITDPNIKSTPVALWGEFSGVIIHLIHEESFRNSQAGFKFRKVIIHANHPQHLFWARGKDPVLIRQDKVLAVAAAIAGVHHVPNYYTDRLFRRKWPSIQKRILQAVMMKYKNRGLSIDLSELVQDDTTETIPSGIEGGDSTWEQVFEEKAHSNTKLYDLLPAAINATNQNSVEWVSPASFPTPVLDWWRGQKQILFSRVTVTDMGDILSVLRECEKQIPGHASICDSLSLQLVLRRIMEIQKTILERDKLLGRKEMALCHSRFDGQPVRVKCPQCIEEGRPLQKPLYSVHRPGHFVIYTRQTCKHCHGRHGFRPIDPDIPWFFGARFSMQSSVPIIHFGERVQTVLQPSTLLTAQQQRPVEIVCLRCQGNAEASDESYTTIDEAPVWTLGHQRPLYVEKQLKCQNCTKLKRVSGRWIPRDAVIPSICRHTLRTLADYYGHYDEIIIAQLMDHWPPSSRRYRLRSNE
jgi:hypothetical protein